MWKIYCATGAVAVVGGLLYSIDTTAPQKPNWVMHTWASIPGGGQATIQTTEKQCRALLVIVHGGNDPMVIRCLGPNGERAETEWLIKRLEKMPPQVRHPIVPPSPPPAKSTKNEGI
jgi:hypothetical protein